MGIIGRLFEGYLGRVAIRKITVAAAEGTLVTWALNFVTPRIQPYITQFWTAAWPKFVAAAAHLGFGIHNIGPENFSFDAHQFSMVVGGAISMALLRFATDAGSVVKSNLQDQNKA